MAQKDAKVNIRLAEISADISQATMQDSKVMKELATESKKDSSAMKTISLLGMVFLPGTFIAVSFLKPLCLNLQIPILKMAHKGSAHISFRQFSQCQLSTGMVMVLPSSSQALGTTGRLPCRLLFLCYWYGHWQGCYHGNHGLRDSLCTVGICQARMLLIRWR
jgi:hypothetical protein